jgi:hypothetical protein
MPKDLEMFENCWRCVFSNFTKSSRLGDWNWSKPSEHGFKALVGYSKKEKLWWAYGVMTKRPKCAQVRASPLSH